MKPNFAIKAVGLALLGAALAWGGYRVGQKDRAAQAPAPARKVLYWHDPMVPGQKFDKPGRSPFMAMDLEPVYADDGATEGGVKVSPTLQQNLGVRLATVRREATRDSFELVGTTQFDESAVQVVQSRVAGYIERLHARAPMQRIRRGEPVALLFVPDWIAPQEEYLALKRGGNNDLAAASRQRMRALSIPDALVAQLDRTGQVQRNVTLTSPASGVVTELAVRDGAMVSPGMTVAKVSGLDKVWLVAEVPELLANSARPGMTVEATFAGDPNRKYTGHVREMLPGVNSATRTVQARLELDNRDGSLTPGMLMRVRLAAANPVSRLLVPTEAVITTGKQSVVMVAGANNGMQPVIVTTGRDFGNDTEILSGLTEGQQVVASGQFLIDSEANLKSVLPKFAGAPAPAAAGPLYRGVGKVEAVSSAAITISHKPIAELKWGAMTMDFSKPFPQAFPAVTAGQDIAFAFRENSEGYVLESVTTGGGKP
jgi:Cu(I)/Ag(I) efflux system membrane fusion protein